MSWRARLITTTSDVVLFVTSLHCRVTSHAWQAVMPGNMRVCLRCGANGWLMP